MFLVFLIILRPTTTVSAEPTVAGALITFVWFQRQPAVRRVQLESLHSFVLSRWLHLMHRHCGPCRTHFRFFCCDDYKHCQKEIERGKTGLALHLMCFLVDCRERGSLNRSDSYHHGRHGWQYCHILHRRQLEQSKVVCVAWPSHPPSQQLEVNCCYTSRAASMPRYLALSFGFLSTWLFWDEAVEEEEEVIVVFFLSLPDFSRKESKRFFHDSWLKTGPKHTVWACFHSSRQHVENCPWNRSPGQFVHFAASGWKVFRLECHNQAAEERPSSQLRAQILPLQTPSEGNNNDNGVDGDDGGGGGGGGRCSSLLRLPGGFSHPPDCSSII